jgi:hypothetical protein
MTQPQLEKDVANYVLAYLARQGYRNTMSKFLQECNLLPPNTTMMVLPETPLSDIVAEYNARKQSSEEFSILTVCVCMCSVSFDARKTWSKSFLEGIVGETWTLLEPTEDVSWHSAWLTSI